MNAQPKAPVRIGIIGMGAMGKGLLYQSSITPEVECRVVCSRNISRCIETLTWLKISHCIATSPAEIDDIIARGLVAVCASGQMVAECASIDAVVESSGSTGSAVEHAMAVLTNHKHLILTNSELDLTFGPLLSSIAEKNGLVFTSCDGDQYGVLKHIIDDVLFWGFELVMAGNIKGFLDRYATPTSIIAEADKRDLNHRICTSFTDGSKLNVEMAIIANACGLTVKTPGMQGPRAAHVSEALNCYNFNELWTDKTPFVDYILGAEPGSGVFVVAHCDNPYQQKMLSYYKMGNGPFYVFYRPYHLCHIESMRGIIGAVNGGQRLLTPAYGLRTNVYAYAKHGLHPGERLDGIGGYACYGMIENVADNMDAPGIPICLAEDVILNREIAKDQKIMLSDLTYDESRLDFRLYAEALHLSVND